MQQIRTTSARASSSSSLSSCLVSIVSSVMFLLLLLLLLFSYSCNACLDDEDDNTVALLSSTVVVASNTEPGAVGQTTTKEQEGQRQRQQQQQRSNSGRSLRGGSGGVSSSIGTTTRQRQIQEVGVQSLSMIDDETDEIVSADLLTTDDGSFIVDVNTLRSDYSVQILAILGIDDEITNSTESVLFDLDSGAYINIDNESPYELYAKSTITSVGEHTVTATAYSEDDGSGSIVGSTITVTFTVQKEAELPQIPRFVGGWESIPDMPLEGWLAEALGTQVGTHLIVTGGFYNSFGAGLRDTLSIDLSADKDTDEYKWRFMERNPINFWTHAGHAVRGTDEMYLCGGYFKKNPGPEMTECYLFNKTANDNQGSYIPIPYLPQGRGGGGLIYIERLDALLFTLGAVRPDGLRSTVDKNSTWIMSLDDNNNFIQNGQWIQKTPSPYLGNHVGAITAYGCTDTTGNKAIDARYYFLGGQEEEREIEDPIDLMYEYIPETDVFIQRASIPVGTGHVTSALIPYGCGFLLVGGATIRGRVDDIFYYDIDNDKWTFIGLYPMDVTTAICGIYNEELTCSTGYTIGGYRRTLTFPTTTNSITSGGTEEREITSTPTTQQPTPNPTTQQPTPNPTTQPTPTPTSAPTNGPTLGPTPMPTFAPTPKPTLLPSLTPITSQPTNIPVSETSSPTSLVVTPNPTTVQPTLGPTPIPTTFAPTDGPTPIPTTFAPTDSPTNGPTVTPTTYPPTLVPTSTPTETPDDDNTAGVTSSPTLVPATIEPTPSPTSLEPTPSPTTTITESPTHLDAVWVINWPVSPIFLSTREPTPAPTPTPAPVVSSDIDITDSSPTNTNNDFWGYLCSVFLFSTCN